MRLATIRTAGGTRAVRREGDTPVETGPAAVGALLANPGWRTAALADGPTPPVDGADFATLVTTPSKVVCVGLNYTNHIVEMGHDLPTHPTLFAKFADALVGAHDDIPLPPETEALDWEVELGVVVGQRVRRAKGESAEAAIAGFTVVDDISCRDWQMRTGEWLQGKTWDSSTPVGPYLVTPDELPGGVRPELEVSLHVDGVLRQRDSTADLLFDPVALVEHISTVVRLNPGDIIATGTPGGVGHGMTPPTYLAQGQVVVAEVEGIGALTNRVVADPTA
ncbi:fumarylacetoacetate hydrolase family protein [Janibacter melonis]|uniref:fumarylacetoacetate hydrolase family protein n=1 Tax=Janibacter melonis TaxID=262209 RepID=UPI002096351D|nr:fumarylacetoacetate hydrolase family protein [Janibacter melonis]